MAAASPELRSTVLGIMSGTSIDSVDYALCSVSRHHIELLGHWQAEFPSSLRRRLHLAAQGQARSHELGQLHHDLGRFYAHAARAGLGRRRPEAIGLHGQTVYHSAISSRPATLQIGEAAWLAEQLRAPVVSNFRAGDLAAGGQGAPLATLFHLLVFGRRGQRVCVNNLGGISNVTLLDWQGRHKPRVLAFDTGPANVLIDLAMREFTHGRRNYDANGAWAAKGQVAEPLLESWLKHRYFRLKPPKSTGRELFGERFWAGAQADFTAAGLSRYDILATLTEFTARSLALNYQLHLPVRPQRVILAGGGAANSHLVARLTTALQAWEAKLEVLTTEELGWPLQSVEPAAFGLLAYRRLHRLAGNLPATTGARRAVVLGQVSAP
jgi:anhydro-N-acetylmuramic acid kinase